MGIGAFFKTIFGASKEEADLKRRAAEEVEKTKNGTSSIEEAKIRLQEAQRRIHRRADKIKQVEEGLSGGTDDGREGTPVPGAG